MTASTRAVLEHVAALGAWDGIDVARMPADEALLAVETGAKAMAALQGLVARFAARVDVVCEQSPGMNGYARRHGYASGPALVAAVSGLAAGEVQRMASLGRGLLAADAAAERAERDARQLAVPFGAPVVLSPEEPLDLLAPIAGAPPLPPHGPKAPRELAPGEYLARAVDAGCMGAAHAEVIRATLADFTIDSRAAEREFVDFARTAGLRKLKQHCFWRLAELDPAGLANREARHVRERFVSVTDGPDGMIHIVGRLPVVNGAPLKTLLDAMTSSAMRRQRKLPLSERLTAGQLCADVVTDVALHAMTCDSVPRRPKTTVVVRIDHAALVDDLRGAGVVDAAGMASCDGILQPITAGTARLMTVQAQILPAVMGGESLPLDLGRARRLFTKAQHIAVTERDRGCIRCSAPPAFCHGHHLQFWADDGPTDLANAVTLCTGCHHRLHEQRWELERVGHGFVVRERERERGPSGDPVPGRIPDRPERHRHEPAA
jgi:hypothetical protein